MIKRLLNSYYLKTTISKLIKNKRRKLKMRKMKPKAKDKIILKKSINGASAYNGKILTVIHVYNGYFTAKADNGDTMNIYMSGSADTWVFYDWKTMSENISEEIESMEKDLSQLKKEQALYKKYDSEEEMVADKLYSIVNAKDKNAVVKVLKELKKSDYL